MSKIRFKKRIMPATGRISQGSFKPSFVDGDEARDCLKKGDGDHVPTCKRGPAGMIARTEKPSEWENTMMIVDPDCKRDANPNGNYVRRIPDRYSRSLRHSQYEIVSYWAQREHNGNLSEALRARENARRVLHQGTWMARDQAFWQGLETDNSKRRYALPTGGSKSNPSARKRRKDKAKSDPKVEKLRAEQYRLFGEIAKRHGINVRKYLANGGTIQALLKAAQA